MARNEVSLTPLYVAVIFFIALAIIPMNAAGAVVVDVTNVFYPTGLMGDKDHVSVLSGADVPEEPGSTKIVYSGAESAGIGWAGVYWQYPKYNWGDHPGLDLSSATKLTFRARGKNGGERAEFMVGGISGGVYEDSIKPPISMGEIELGRDWNDYIINFYKTDDLTQVIGGFCWLTTDNTRPGDVIYLKEIKYEK
jgi:hypothetical protein